MSEPIVYIDRSDVREGKLGELKAAIEELVNFVESNEARAIAYSVYLNEDGSQMTVVQVHPDSASLEFHMEVAGPAFPKFKKESSDQTEQPGAFEAKIFAPTNSLDCLIGNKVED